MDFGFSPDRIPAVGKGVALPTRARRGWPLQHSSASIALLAALSLHLSAPPQALPTELPSAEAAPRPSCPRPERIRPAAASSQLLSPPLRAVEGNGVQTSRLDYRHRLASTAAGWPTRKHWCVWLEPLDADGPATRWDRRWMDAVQAALGRWERELPIRVVSDRDAAQVQILRQRPPLRWDRDHRPRASHGRATLRVMEVLHQGTWWLEPHVTVLISPGQRAPAIEATTLHELGHAFGLWGHSEDPGDVMAAVPTADPVLDLSSRDRSTLRWLYAQPTPYGKPLGDQPPTVPHAPLPHGQEHQPSP